MTPPKPTIFLTNWSSRKLFGPGRPFSMMVYPPAWGRDNVPLLTPEADDFNALRNERIDVAEYRRRYYAAIAARTADGTHSLAPGAHSPVAVRDGLIIRHLLPGDTLCCMCARDAAAEGRCHRVFAADLLSKAGWNVVLDGALVAR